MNARTMLALATLAGGLASVGGSRVAAAEAISGPVNCVESTPDSNYPPGPPTCNERPGLLVDSVNSVCVLETPYIEYSLVVVGEADVSNGASITFVNPTGDDYTVSGAPLSGRALWPGTVLDGGGAVVDWPGWRQVSGGMWVEGDEWSWTRPVVTLIVEANPAATAQVAYWADSPECDPPQVEVLGNPPAVGANPFPTFELPATR